MKLISVCLVGCVLAVSAARAAEDAPSRRPNVVVLYADDKD